jgi:hypothetical protein
MEIISKIQTHKPKAPRTRQEQIAERLEQIPESQRLKAAISSNTGSVPVGQKGYLKASQGKASPRSAIKSFCCECMGYDRGEVTLCSDGACPLYLYRPFKTAAPPAQ